MLLLKLCEIHMAGHFATVTQIIRTSMFFIASLKFNMENTGQVPYVLAYD